MPHECWEATQDSVVGIVRVDARGCGSVACPAPNGGLRPARLGRARFRIVLSRL